MFLPSAIELKVNNIKLRAENNTVLCKSVFWNGHVRVECNEEG